MGGEVDFLPADKHKSLLQVDNITLVVRSQVWNVFEISQFFVFKQISKVSSNLCCHFNVYVARRARTPKITNLLFLCDILRKKQVMK